jgi:predicted ATPase with chaperone activity
MRVSMQLFAMLLTAAWLLFVPGANAQNQSASPKAQNQSASPKAQNQSASPNIPDQKLDAAAAALDRVTSIKQNYQQKMATAAPSDKDRIAGDANNAMKKAVTDQGLSVDEYTSILQVAQNDPGVREKLMQRLHSPAQ